MTTILFLGIRYSMRDLLSDLNIRHKLCRTHKLASSDMRQIRKNDFSVLLWHQLALTSCELYV